MVALPSFACRIGDLTTYLSLWRSLCHGKQSVLGLKQQQLELLSRKTGKNEEANLGGTEGRKMYAEST